MPLNNRQIQTAKPESTAYTLRDGNGLMLLIRPNGKKTWQYKFRFNGKEQLLTIGQYPQISLVQARQALEQAKSMLSNGINPAAAKQESKAQQKIAQLNCFENVARDWHGKNMHKWHTYTKYRLPIGHLNCCATCTS